MDENELRELNRFWFILGFIQAKITESSDLFDKNWDRFANMLAEKNESDNNKETTDDSEGVAPEVPDMKEEDIGLER